MNTEFIKKKCESFEIVRTKSTKQKKVPTISFAWNG